MNAPKRAISQPRNVFNRQRASVQPRLGPSNRLEETHASPTALTNKKLSVFIENKERNQAKRNIKEMLQRTQDHMAGETAADSDSKV